MSLELTHDDVRAALAAEALDALDGDERAAVRAHLKECEECRREVGGLREGAGALAWAAPHRPMEPARADRVRARLLARAHADREGGQAASAGPSASSENVVTQTLATPAAAAPGVISIDRARRERPTGRNLGWLAAAASVALLIALGAYTLSLRSKVRGEAERAVALGRENRDLERQVAARDSTLAGLSSPGVRVIDLASTRRQAPAGRMFWNPATDRWTFFAQNLPALRTGRDYQLWLITPQGPIGAGTFKPDGSGGATVQATYDLPPDQLRAVAVTEEPEGGLPQPSGTPLILGATE
jgi:hypothetical protein